MKRATKRGIYFITIGSAIVLLYQVVDPQVPQPYSVWLNPILFVLFLIGVALVGVGLFLATVQFIPMLGAGDEFCRPARHTDELRCLHNFSNEYFPEETFTLSQAKNLRKLYNRSIWGVWRERRKWLSHGLDAKVVGFFSMIPINTEGKSLLDAAEFQPTDISAVTVVRKPEDASALYIGGIAALPKHKAYVIAQAMLRITEFIASGIQFIYSRPTTKAGLTLISRHDFKPVKDKGLDHIYKLGIKAPSDNEQIEERANRVIERYESREDATKD